MQYKSLSLNEEIRNFSFFLKKIYNSPNAKKKGFLKYEARRLLTKKVYLSIFRNVYFE